MLDKQLSALQRSPREPRPHALLEAYLFGTNMLSHELETSDLSAGEALKQLDALIEKFGGRHFTSLPFSREYEKLFEERTGSFRARRMWREGLATIALCFTCLLMDLVALEDPYWTKVVRQMLLTMPLALLANEAVRREPPMWIRESVVAITIIAIASINILLQASAGMAGVFYGLMTTIICALFVSSAMRLRFQYQITTMACLSTAVYISLITTPYLGSPIRVLAMSVFTLAMGLVLLSAYSLEREERVGFLLRMRGDIRERAITSSNAALLEAAQSDSLTGLGNRRLLEDRLSGLWRRASAGANSVSVIVLDVDRFKLVNDSYGHTYGDQVLVRIASLIKSALHNSEDLAVRWGGEEFIVLLPDTEVEGAVIVAERIRSLVEMAGSPPSLSRRSHTSDFQPTTVSCGVCGCVPSPELSSEVLIASADVALYEAKQSGRNRVVSHLSAQGVREMVSGPQPITVVA